MYHDLIYSFSCCFCDLVVLENIVIFLPLFILVFISSWAFPSVVIATPRYFPLSAPFIYYSPIASLQLCPFFRLQDFHISLDSSSFRISCTLFVVSELCNSYLLPPRIGHPKNTACIMSLYIEISLFLH